MEGEGGRREGGRIERRKSKGRDGTNKVRKRERGREENKQPN